MRGDHGSLRHLHTTLGEICDGVVDKRGPRDGEWFTYVDISSIDRDSKRIFDPKLLRVAEAPSRAKQVIKEGDVLISMTRPNLNAVAKVPRELDGAVCSTGFHVLRSKSAHPGYLHYLVQTPKFINAMETVVQGALYPAVRPKDISSFPILLPSSFQAQQLLADHLDLQLSRLDAAVAALKRAQANLKRYRASVLQAAVTGRLVPTEHDLAQAEGRDYETGEQLLERILTERRRTWSGRGKYKEPIRAESGKEAERLSRNYQVPDGWTVATAEQLCEATRSITYGVIKLGNFQPDGVPTLRSSDVRPLRIRLDNVKRISPQIANSYNRTFLNGGEVLVTVRGTLGGIAAVPLACRGFNISREVAMLAILPPASAPFVASMIASSSLQVWLTRSTKGIAYTGINIEALKRLPIPLPPYAEQARILEEVERRLSVADRLEATLEANLRRATRLRLAILKKAFSHEVLIPGEQGGP